MIKLNRIANNIESMNTAQMIQQLYSLLIHIKKPLFVVFLCGIGCSGCALTLPWLFSLWHRQDHYAFLWISMFVLLYEMLMLIQQWLTTPLFIQVKHLIKQHIWSSWQNQLHTTQLHHQQQLELPNLVAECLSLLLFHYSYFFMQLIFLMIVVYQYGTELLILYIFCVLCQLIIMRFFHHLPSALAEQHLNQQKAHAQHIDLHKQWSTIRQQNHHNEQLRQLHHQHDQLNQQAHHLHRQYEQQNKLLSMISIIFQLGLLYWCSYYAQNYTLALLLTGRSLMQSTQKQMQSWSSHLEKYLRLKRIWPHNQSVQTVIKDRIYSIMMIFSCNECVHIKPGSYHLFQWSDHDICALKYALNNQPNEHDILVLINHKIHPKDTYFNTIHSLTQKPYFPNACLEDIIINGHHDQQRYELVYQQLMLADLDQLISNQSVNQLTLGDQQRLALARVMFQNPSICLINQSCSHIPIAIQHHYWTSLRTYCPNTIFLIANSPYLSTQNHTVILPPKKQY
ncbi:MAG: hypothetical protein ACON5A_01190 [Candidatus Comchoanobacterales bacterium]